MHKAIKFILSILTVLSGGAFWFLAGGAASEAVGLLPLYALIDLVFFLAALGLSFIFLPYAAIALTMALSTLPIFLYLENYALASGIVFAFSLLSLLPARWIKKEAEERVEFSAWGILRKGFGTLLTILALSLAAFFYPLNGIARFEEVIPRNFFDKTISVLGDAPGARSIFPFDIPDPKKTVDQVLIEAIRLEARDTWDRMPEEEKARILEDARGELARNLGISSVEGNAEIGDVLYRGSIEFIEERFGAYRRYLPAVFVLAVFGAFRTLFIILGPVSIALVWIITKILLYAGVLVLSQRQVLQEYIEIK